MRRLLAFLPMMLLAAALSAQSNCQISNISVVWTPGPASCQFFALVNFEHTGTTNQFKVQGNGQIYGPFTYNVLPVSIGPFTASDVPTTLEFVVSDLIVPDCQAVVETVLPACNSNTNCAISNVAVQTGDCLPNGTGFKVWLNFEVENPGNDFFEVWTSGNVYLGIFPISTLPLLLPTFAWNGDSIQELQICINDNANCCAVVEFSAPPCINLPPPCTISNLKVDVGDCTTDSTFSVTLNFNVQDSTLVDSFFVSANGQSLGAFGLNQLPLTLDSLDWNGLLFTHLTVCTGNLPGCCREIQVIAPDCLPFEPCEVTDIYTNPISCTSDSTYKLRLNFQATNPGQDSFAVYANGVLLGNFPHSILPLTIDSFPWSGNNFDVVKICVQQDNSSVPCCRTEEFHVPDCLNQGDDCEIFDLQVETGACHPDDSTYVLVVNFQVQNPPSNTFQLWANGQVFGIYNLGQLPLTIPNLPWNGGANDVVKVCFGNSIGSVGCCKTLEFAVPDCFGQGGDCEIFDLHVETGDCHPDQGTYVVVVNFQVQNPPSSQFQLWANGQVFGIYNLSQLPLTIPNFPWNGGANDVVKVCMGTPNAPQNCCKTLEFAVPDCMNPGGDCEIFDLVVDTGACHPDDSTYVLVVNFQVQNPPSNTFQLWANGQVFGTYNLSQLPLTIPNFPWNGGANDVIKVCFGNSGAVGCCKTLEFAVPDCFNQGGDCEIFDLQVETGDCHPDQGTYVVVVNFQVQNPPSSQFQLWANGQVFGIYNLSQLPLTIPNFPWNGGANDVVKVCMGTPNAPQNCCKTLEFAVPDCMNPGGDCEIFDLVVDTGDCTSDSTYSIWINFEVQNAPSGMFALWANGQMFGTYNLNQLPLNIPNFPWNGGPNDYLKVCIAATNTPSACCRTIEFPVPDCLGGPNDDCHISDLQVIKTPCLCGQFFAVITFEHDNGGPGGFDIVGNGNNYGNYAYNHPQPIIIGPLDGDGVTQYEFAVVDHLNDDCHDAALLGKVECTTPADEVAGQVGHMVLSPNPASNHINVNATLPGLGNLGEATVEVYHADGRRVRSFNVPEGSNFRMDVFDLPAGIYRLSLLTGGGRVEGTFVKQ